MTPLDRTRLLAIEQEFAQPWREVIAGFAADGYNKAVTAGALDIPADSFYKMLARLAEIGITFDWPCPYKSWDRPPKPHTERQIETARENLLRAQEAAREYWRTKPLGTREGFEQVVKMRNDECLTWARIAERLGVDLSTVMRARKRYGVPDPLGKTLQRNARKLINERNNAEIKRKQHAG